MCIILPTLHALLLLSVVKKTRIEKGCVSSTSIIFRIEINAVECSLMYEGHYIIE